MHLIEEQEKEVSKIKNMDIPSEKKKSLIRESRMSRLNSSNSSLTTILTIGIIHIFLIFNYYTANTMVGSGIFTLPIKFHSSGLITSLIVLIVIGIKNSKIRIHFLHDC